jgi:hypothetical protein
MKMSRNDLGCEARESANSSSNLWGDDGVHGGPMARIERKLG